MVRPAVLALMAAAMVVEPLASEEPSKVTEAVALVERFAGAQSRDAYAAFCDPDTVIVDHVPPYVFRGPHACEDEWDAVVAWTERNGIEVSDYGSLQEPAFVDVTGEHIYIVFPATASMTRNGRAETERGIWTFVLRQHDQEWRIGSMTWSTLDFRASTGTSNAP